jgi:hypothetical protein
MSKENPLWGAPRIHGELTKLGITVFASTGVLGLREALRPDDNPEVLRTLFLQFEEPDWEKELADFYHTDVDVPAILPDGDAETSGCRDGYLWLQNQGPPQASGLPKIVPLPELSEGPHLSYAIQWFSFACVALIGWGVLIRKEARAQKPAASGTEDADPG